MATHKQLLDEVDSYKDTVWMILAFIHEMSWDDTKKAVRADVTHEHGALQAASSTSVTPDVALVLGSDCGLVGDAKLSFATQATGRAKIREQLLKYDAVLTNWVGNPKQPGRVRDVASVLLTHLTREVDAEDYLENERKAGRFVPTHPFAIVGCVRSDQRTTSYMLRRRTGALFPKDKDEKLRRGVPVALEHLIASYGYILFYDAPPPLAYLLEVLWDKVFPMYAKEEAFRTSREGRPSAATHPRIVVEIPQLADDLRDKFSMKLLNPSLPECPRRDLVRGAMDMLVRWKLAAVVKGGRYEVAYRKLNGGTLNYLLRKLSPQKGAKRPASGSNAQLDLFGRSIEKAPTK